MPSSSYYRVIHGVKYDDRILKAAEAVAQQPCHDKSLAIDRERALPIVAAATDGKSVTAVERRTIKRVLDTYTFTPDAKADLLELLEPPPPPTSGGADEEEGKEEDAWLYHSREPDPPFYQCRMA